jgi:Sigma-70 region 2
MMGPNNFEAEIFAYIQSKVGDPATADDLTQETFVKVSRALAKGPTSEDFREWLYPGREVREEWGLATATQPRIAHSRIRSTSLSVISSFVRS